MWSLDPGMARPLLMDRSFSCLMSEGTIADLKIGAVIGFPLVWGIKSSFFITYFGEKTPATPKPGAFSPPVGALLKAC